MEPEEEIEDLKSALLQWRNLQAARAEVWQRVIDAQTQLNQLDAQLKDAKRIAVSRSGVGKGRDRRFVEASGVVFEVRWFSGQTVSIDQIEIER